MIDLAAPWLSPLGAAPGLAWQHWQAGASVADALNRAGAASAATLPPGGALPRFVPQAALPAGEAYEACIHRCAQVPTRDHLHDFFNGVVWLALPALKWRLNALQAAEIARHGVGAQRGPVRDALTLFDESGAVLQAPAPLLLALQQRDWPALFIRQRLLWQQARLLIVGHALLEKLATAPRKALTAQVLLADPLALDAAGWAAKPFAPLPVLGVPGWWPANEAPGFYDDAAVFRPRRTHTLRPAESRRSTDSARRCRS